MKQNKLFFLGLCLLLVPVLNPGNGLCSIRLGQSCALKGPAAFLGTEMHKGAKAYFGKHASVIELIKKDDGYEPDRCKKNTETFIRNEIDALFGYVGTPTSKVAVPLATKSKTIYFGAFTGASFLSDNIKNPYSFSVRGSYNAEIENMMRHLKDDLGITRVGLFVQRDAFGMAGVRGAVLADRLVDGIEVFPAVPAIPAADADEKEWDSFWQNIPNFKRNTVMMGRGTRQIIGNRVQAVIFVGAYRPCAFAINQLHRLGFKGPMINISFVGSVGLAKLLKKTDNVYISQVVPNPWDSTIPVVKEYQRDLGDTNYGFVSLEGYIAAKIFHQSVKSIKGKINSDAIKLTLESMGKYDIGGIKVSFAPDDHRGMDSIYLTAIGKSGDAVKFTYVDKLKADL